MNNGLRGDCRRGLFGAIGVAVDNVLLKRPAERADPLMAPGWQFILGLAVAVAFRFSLGFGGWLMWNICCSGRD